MDFTYTLRIPMKRYLKKYLLSKVKKIDNYTMSLKDPFGVMLYGLLSEATFNPRIEQQGKYDDELIITIPAHYSSIRKTELLEKQIDLFNEFVYELLNHEFISFMKMSDYFGIQRQISIENFATNANLELDIDINLETLKKKYYRYRKQFGSIRKSMKIKNDKNVIFV